MIVLLVITSVLNWTQTATRSQWIYKREIGTFGEVDDQVHSGSVEQGRVSKEGIWKFSFGTFSRSRVAMVHVDRLVPLFFNYYMVKYGLFWQ